MRVLVLLLLPLMAACSNFPELDAAQSSGARDAPFPRLLPLDRLLTGPAPRASADDIDTITARAAGLDARAGRIASRRATGADLRRLSRLRQRADALRATD